MAMQQHHSPRGHSMSVSNRPDSHLINRQVKHRRDGLPHGRQMRSHFGPFGQDHAVEVHNVHSMMSNPYQRFVHEIGTVAASILRIVIGKQLADVRFGNGTQQRVGNGVKQDVRIAMADRVDVGWNVDAADAQRSMIAKPMGVVSKTNSQGWQ